MDADPAPVGRARELAEIDRALDRPAAASPWLVQIAGEPGIGKSLLLGELRRRAAARGHLVLDGRATELERDIPFVLVVDALNDHLASLDRRVLRALDADLLAELGAILPALPRAGARAATAEAGAERYRLHYAIRLLLERLAARRPVALALDDVHWADAASVEVLMHLLRRFRGPLLVAVAYRPVSSRPLIALRAAAGAAPGTRLELAPLSLEEAGGLLGDGLDGPARAELHRQSGGNPFYIEELVRAAGRRRGPARRTRPGAADGPVPAAVAAAIDAELAGVSGAARITLRAAAVAGEPFEPELVAQIAGQEPGAVLTALDELLGLGLVRVADGPRRFRFRHPIMRRAVYDGAPAGWRIGAHARAAAVLAATGAPAAVRAHHVERSAAPGDEQAVALLVAAGREAAPRAPEAAARLLLAATRLLAAGPRAGPTRAELLAEAGAALTFAGAYDEALDVLERAGRDLPAHSAAGRAHLAGSVAFARRMSGRPLESRPLLERALASLAPGGGEALALTLDVALDHYWRGAFAEMHDVAAGVLARSREGADGLLWTWAAALCSLASSSLDRFAPALAELQEAEAACGALADERLAERIEVAGYVAHAASALERTQGALDHARRGIRLARTTGQRPFVPGLLVIETNALFMQGRIAEALVAAETATDAAVLTGNDQFAAWALWADSVVCAAAGEAERALAGAREAAARARGLAGTVFASLSRLHLAVALSAGGDVEGARLELAALESGPDRRLLDLRGGHGWDLLVRTQLAAGDVAGAAAAARAAEARARATALPQRLGTALCSGAAVRLERGEAERALAAAREAVPFARVAGNPVLESRARALTGVALGRLGDPREAIAELERAERTLVAFGARREADAAARELRRLGRRAPRRPAAVASGRRPGALSAREREVASLVAAGQRNRDVAAALFVSEKTVESHLARIYDKLGVRSRAALAAALAAAGEVTPRRAPPG